MAVAVLYLPSVGDAPCGVPRVGVYRHTPCGMAVTLRTPHNALLRKAAQFSDLRLLFCAFFLARKKGPKKVLLFTAVTKYFRRTAKVS